MPSLWRIPLIYPSGPRKYRRIWTHTWSEHDYSQPLSPSGDVFGYGVDPQAMAVHRVPQAAAGSGARLHTSLSSHQHQDTPRQHRPQPRPKSPAWGRRYPTASWPSSIHASPRRHPALLQHTAETSRQILPLPLPFLLPGMTDHHHHLFNLWKKCCSKKVQWVKCLKRQQQRPGEVQLGMNSYHLIPKWPFRERTRKGQKKRRQVYLLLVPGFRAPSNWLLFFYSPVCSLLPLSLSPSPVQSYSVFASPLHFSLSHCALNSEPLEKKKKKGGDSLTPSISHTHTHTHTHTQQSSIKSLYK